MKCKNCGKDVSNPTNYQKTFKVCSVLCELESRTPQQRARGQSSLGKKTDKPAENPNAGMVYYYDCNDCGMHGYQSYNPNLTKCPDCGSENLHQR